MTVAEVGDAAFVAVGDAVLAGVDVDVVPAAGYDKADFDSAHLADEAAEVVETELAGAEVAAVSSDAVVDEDVAVVGHVVDALLAVAGYAVDGQLVNDEDVENFADVAGSGHNHESRLPLAARRASKVVNLRGTVDGAGTGCDVVAKVDE